MYFLTLNNNFAYLSGVDLIKIFIVNLLTHLNSETTAFI
jgi:hypothetical protein